MYLFDMEAELYDQLNYGDNPATPVINRVRRNLNVVYKQLLSKKGMSGLRRQVLSFASVSGTPFAVTPQALSRIITITDRTNRINLDPISLADIRYNDPGQASSTSVPSAFAIENMAAPVAMDPTAAAELFVKSTSAADGAGVDVYLSGVVTGGYPRTTHGSMNGVTATTIDASITTWEQVKRFRLNQVAAGYVTLLQGSGAGTELARIAPGRASARYTRILLYPTPSASVTYYADCEIYVDELLAPFDEPVIPDNFQWLLTCGALMREYLKKEKAAEYSAEASRWKDGIADLRVYLQRQAGVNRREVPRRFSQLGSNFSAGS